MNCTLIAVIFITLLIFSVFLSSFVFKKGASARKAVTVQVLTFFLIPIICGASAVMTTNASHNQADGETSAVSQEASDPSKKGLGHIAMAIAITGGSIGAGLAVASAAPAAIGAISENPKSFGKAMVFVVLAEGVCVFALLVSIFILAGLNG